MTVEELKKELDFCQDSWHVYIEAVGRNHATVLTELIIEKQNGKSVVILTDYGHEKASIS